MSTVAKKVEPTVVAVDEERRLGIVLLKGIDNVGVPCVWTVIFKHNPEAAVRVQSKIENW